MRISQAGWGAPNKHGGYKISLKIDFFFFPKAGVLCFWKTFSHFEGKKLENFEETKC